MKLLFRRYIGNCEFETQRAAMQRSSTVGRCNKDVCPRIMTCVSAMLFVMHLPRKGLHRFNLHNLDLFLQTCTAVVTHYAPFVADNGYTKIQSAMRHIEFCGHVRLQQKHPWSRHGSTEDLRGCSWHVHPHLSVLAAQPYVASSKTPPLQSFLGGVKAKK